MPFIATCVDASGTVFWDRPSSVTDMNVTNQNHMEQYQNHTQTMGISH